LPHFPQSPQAQTAYPQEHWIVLVVEFVHLLGLFLIHTMHSKSDRATAVLFDQMVRHLNILDKMPGHDGAMMIRQVLERDPMALRPPNYMVLFGNITLRGDTASGQPRYTQGQISHFDSALRQAFSCLAEQGIHALFLQLPGHSKIQVDRLRLALNIVARFRFVADNADSIAFRYYGRTMAVPLIRDRFGQADPNLTLVAGLNGLSATNTMELVKQAEAYGQLKAGTEMSSRSEQPVNWYNHIFGEPRLRRQLIRPPIEINNLPWATASAQRSENISQGNVIDGGQPGQHQYRMALTEDHGTDIPHQTVDTLQSARPVVNRDFLLHHLSPCNQKTIHAVDRILAEDYPVLSPSGFGRRLADLSHVMEVLAERTSDPEIMETVLIYLNAHLEWIPDTVLLSLHLQRKGIRVDNGENTLFLGMVHPRLFDLVSLVKERLLTRLKIEAVQSFTLGFEQNNEEKLATRFEISPSDARAIIALLKNCFDDQGRFRRQEFEGRIDQITPYQTPIFEMLWCLFKQTADRQGRLDFLNAIQLLTARLDDAKDALQFLLSDIFQNPLEVKHMDRNAMVLANILLRTHNQELKIDIHQTPEEVLQVQKGIERQIQQYVAWRLEFDQARILTKIRAIGDLLHLPAEEENQGRITLFDSMFLMALEREAFIFFALVGGKTSRIILRQALERYMLRLEVLDKEMDVSSMDLSKAINQSMIIVQGLGRIGRPKDVAMLEQLRNRLNNLSTLPTSEGVKVCISGLFSQLSRAIKAIQNG
jgi:hypothetical protein